MARTRFSRIAQALLSGDPKHAHLYATSASFRHSVDQTAGLCEVLVDALADRAVVHARTVEAVAYLAERGADVSRYADDLRVPGAPPSDHDPEPGGTS
jgi:hypothetical protein